MKQKRKNFSVPAHLNMYSALLIITLVASGATMLIMKAIAVADESTLAQVDPLSKIEHLNATQTPTIPAR